MTIVHVLLISALALSLAACPVAKDAADETADGSTSPVERPSEPAPPAGVFADPVAAAPENYAALADTHFVRLLRAAWPAAGSDRAHGHPTSIWYALTDMSLRIELANGILPRRIAAGESGVQPPVHHHVVSNAGSDPAELLMFEIRDEFPPEPGHAPGGAPRATAAGNEFQLLEEHGRYRLVKVELAPKQTTGVHSHPGGLWVALTPVRLATAFPVAEPGFAETHTLDAGDVLVTARVSSHAVKNVGPETARFLILEGD